MNINVDDCRGVSDVESIVSARSVRRVASNEIYIEDWSGLSTCIIVYPARPPIKKKERNDEPDLLVLLFIH